MLYQNVRPSTLEEVIGNKSTVEALKKMLKSRQKPHSILFQGGSGCGKTTLARIIAKELGANTESILELNAANTRGVEDVREIARTAPLSTFAGGPKVYIIDESHQLTAAAQECFLKILEDNPENCYFILCTTDPEHLIKTIRNRCTSYDVGKLRTSEIKELVDNACKKAELNVSEEIKEVVAATSEGSPRATLVALEKVADITDLDTAILLCLKGTEKDVQIIDLCKAMNTSPELRKQKWSTIINLFDMIEEGDVERVRKSIQTYLYKELVKCSDSSIALDLAHLIRIFSGNCFYGGKAMLGSLVAQACFLKNFYNLD